MVFFQLIGVSDLVLVYICIVLGAAVPCATVLLDDSLLDRKSRGNIFAWLHKLFWRMTGKGVGQMAFLLD